MVRKRIIIDLRTSGNDYWHVKNSIAIDASELRNRLYELPDGKVCYIDLLGSSKLVLDSTKQFLESRKWAVCNIWNLQDEKTDEVPAGMPPFSNFEIVMGPQQMLPLLCDPCPLLLNVIKTIELSIADSKTCLDFGCGSGRDTMFLALRGFQVTAVDFESGLLLRVSNWAKRFGNYVKDNITLSRTKLRKDGMWKVYEDFETSKHMVYPPVRTPPLKRLHQLCGKMADGSSVSLLWFETQYDCVLLSRFFLRIPGVFDIFGNLVKPGGFFILHQFYADDAAEFANRFGHPKDPDRIIQKDDLEFFKSYEWEIMKNEVDTLVDGRTVINFVAKKLIIGQ